MKTNTKGNVIRMAQMGMLAALALVLVTVTQFPIIPAAPFLKYDMADVPILLGTLFFGTIPGLAILLVVSLVQAFLLGGDGWIGLVMHFVASGALVVLVGQFTRWHNKFHETIVGMALGTLAMTALMIPLNLVLTSYFQGVPMQAVVEMIIPVIIPFNLIKASANCVITGVVYKSLQPFMRRHKELVGQP